MNAPQHDPRSFEDDPTGIRALLGGLPDPGPMPAELVARIQASLSQEAARGTVVDLAAYRGRRHGLRPLHWAAAAGLVAVAGGGVLATGAGGGLLTAFTGGASSASSVATTAGRAAGGAAADTAGSTGPQQGFIGSAQAAATTVAVADGTWTGQDLSGPASEALTASTAGADATLPSDPAFGLLGTLAGARDCASALGLPTNAGIVVELGTHEGRPAALVVATTAGGERTAYLVGRDCGPGNPAVRLGPQRLGN